MNKHTNPLSKILRRSALALISCVVHSFPAHTSASVTLDVNGSGDAAEAIGPSVLWTGAAAGFELLQDHTHVSFSADIQCFSCSGTAYLMQNDIGTGASVIDLLALSDITAGNPIVSGLNLQANDYYVVVLVDAGFITWGASSAPVVTGGSGVADGLHYTLDDADVNVSFPPTSDFTAKAGSWHYSVSAIVVPEPSTLPLLLSGLASLALFRRRRQRS